MKIYICGQISGLPFGEAAHNFKKAERELACAYPEAEIVNPVEQCKIIASNYRLPMAIAEDWVWCMTADFRLLIDCTHIAVMHNAGDSVGARIERAIARELGIPEVVL
jgi:hypothetical protein